MQVELLGTGGPLGWPVADCRCASCARMRAAGHHWEPTRVVVEGVPLERCPGRDVPGGRDVRPPGGGRLLFAAGPAARPEPAEPGPYDAVLLDLIGAPEHLARLRRGGTVTGDTHVRAVHNDHRISSPAELVRRLAWWTQPLAAHPEVTYVATGKVPGAGDPPAGGDQEWAARVAAHRARRPSWWTTVETTDLPNVLRTAREAVLIDGIGTWLAAVLDEANAWESPEAVRPRLDELVAAWRATDAHVVAVSDEVGLSVVPATPAGRAFRDLLGELNRRLAAESEEATLVVAGRAVELPA